MALKHEGSCHITAFFLSFIFPHSLLISLYITNSILLVLFLSFKLNLCGLLIHFLFLGEVLIFVSLPHASLLDQWDFKLPFLLHHYNLELLGNKVLLQRGPHLTLIHIFLPHWVCLNHGRRRWDHISLILAVRFKGSGIYFNYLNI